MAKGRSEPDGDTAATRRGRPRSAETTNAILQSAYTLMATTGLAATSIDAVARHSNVSKMTIYKWWPSREALLIDAFLNHASLMLPLPTTGTPADRLRSHAAAYAKALQGEFGRVQLAVISECISNTGSAEIFYERYLRYRQDSPGRTDRCRPAGRKHWRRRDAGGPVRRDLWQPVLPLHLRNQADLAGAGPQSRRHPADDQEPLTPRARLRRARRNHAHVSRVTAR